MKLRADLSQLKVAIVYDWLDTAYGGAEQVVGALTQTFPQADLWATVYHPQRARWLSGTPIKTSFINKIPGTAGHRWWLPLMPLAIENIDLKSYQVVISVTSSLANGCLTTPDQVHLCYLLSPPRFLDHAYLAYQAAHPILSWRLGQPLVKLVKRYLNWWNQAAMARPDIIIPLSQVIKNRFQNKYQLATGPVIYPPLDFKIDWELNQKATSPEQKSANDFPFQVDQIFSALPPTKLSLAKLLTQPYGLIVSRLVPYKKIDQAIKACWQIGYPLVIVGKGTAEKSLQHLAHQLSHSSAATDSPVELAHRRQIYFLGAQPQSIVDQLLSHCQCYLQPGDEDFGLSPLQANLAGRPAIITRYSGAAEVISPAQQSLLLTTGSAAEIEARLTQLNGHKFRAADLQPNYDYTTIHFSQKIQNVVKQLISNIKSY